MSEAPSSRRLSIVLPVYRNEGAVTLTCTRIRALLDERCPDYRYEMIFVDDGSDDGSLQELLALRAQDPRVRVVSFTRNFGQIAAMTAGIRAACGDAVVNLSADLQDPVELLADMVRAWEQGSEVVVAYRRSREDGLSRRFSSWLFYRIIRFSIPSMPAGGFDYILMDRKVVDAFNQSQVKNRFFQGDILWFGYRTAFIPYTRTRRPLGRSQYTFAKRLKNSLDAILDASYLPIRLISLLGVVTAIGGFFYGLTVVWARFVHLVPFPGWAPIMIVVLVIGGCLMLMLGVIGEYVWRIYDEVRQKPIYVIRETHG